MVAQERQKLLDEYAIASRAFADSVERLRHVNGDVEAFIRALDETGTAHRTCEQVHVRLDKHLAQK
jgi:hypothetical protein